jgi:hypothetical protein
MSEEALVKSIIDKIPLPQEVLSVDFSFSEDSTGMPAVWINLHVSEDYNPTAQKVSKLSALKKLISSKIFEEKVASWPYIRLIAD